MFGAKLWIYSRKAKKEAAVPVKEGRGLGDGTDRKVSRDYLTATLVLLTM